MLLFNEIYNWTCSFCGNKIPEHLCYTITWKRSKCKWTLRLCRSFHLALLFPNSISQRCVPLLSQINCMFRSQKIGFELFCPLAVTFGILKGSWWHGRSKRIWAIFGEKPKQVFSIIFCQLEHLYKRLCVLLLHNLFLGIYRGKQKQANCVTMYIWYLGIFVLNSKQKENKIKRMEEEQASRGDWPTLPKKKWTRNKMHHCEKSETLRFKGTQRI